jgi:hypothetical protein
MYTLRKEIKIMYDRVYLEYKYNTIRNKVESYPEIK